MLSAVLDYGNSFDYTFEQEVLSLRDWSRLLHAGKIARKSKHRFRLGCVVVKSKRVYATAVNKAKSHPELFPNRMSVHAEIAALSKMQDAQGATVYVARLGQTEDTFRVALPCLYCIDVMLTRGITKVVCTLDDNTAVSFKLSSVKSSYLV